MIDPEVVVRNAENADEVFEVWYVTDELSEGIYCSVVANIPDFNTDGTRGLNFRVTDEQPFRTYGQSGVGSGRREAEEVSELNGLSADTALLAAGMYLSYLETHRFEEQVAWDILREGVGENWVNGVRQELDELSRKERAGKMMTQIEENANMNLNLDLKMSMKKGEWRDTGLSSDDAELARDLLESIETDPRTCYLTAQRAYKQASDHDRVDYCEGLAFQKQTGRTTHHAWIEIDGCVAELTWPWHRVDAGEATYYGTTISDDLFHDRLEVRGPAPKLLLDDEERKLMAQARMQAQAEDSSSGSLYRPIHFNLNENMW